MEIPEGYVVSVAPELFKFERIGDQLAGTLVAIQKVKIFDEELRQDKLIVEVIVETERGVFKFRPGFDVRSKLRMRMMGNMILIKYLGVDDAKGKDGNGMKVFAVLWKPNDAAAASAPPKNKLEDGSYITDDDIPF